jgi:hypothetical protein
MTLADISDSVRIRQARLEALEHGDLSGWPKGLYARAWIRAYAEAIGLDPAETVDEFCRLFPHGDRRARVTLDDLAAIVDAPPPFLDDEAVQGAVYGRRESDRVALLPPRSLRDRIARALSIVADIRRMSELPARLAETWRTLRPSRPTF